MIAPISDNEIEKKNEERKEKQMKALAIIAALIVSCYLGIEGYAWHWVPFAVFASWLTFAMLLIYGFWKFIEFAS